MLIDGLQKFSALDYPGKLSAVIFTFGCNFRCGFCHNPQLVRPELRDTSTGITDASVIDFLHSRRGLLDGVVITGGEPTLQADLDNFIRKVRALGFLIKLDTNGADSQALSCLLDEDLLDFVAMDIKHVLSRYDETVGRTVDAAEIQKSISLIMNSGVDYEFRSTLVSGLHDRQDVLQIAQSITGAKKYVLQKFISRDNLVDAGFKDRQSFGEEELKKLAQECEQWVQACEVRR